MTDGKRLSMLVGSGALIVSTFVPVFAQSSIEPNQPVRGYMHSKEAGLQQQLNLDYQAGLIDPLELANKSRDLDAIKVKEESYRMRKQGMTDTAAARVDRKLNQFQSNLDNSTGDKGSVSATVIRREY